jgi:CheY-like chemotaxis protein
MAIKLLVADDSVTMQKVVSLAFSDEDVVIESVLSGDVAIDRARIFRPDIVLADVVMPGCNGYEICSRIKEDRELGDTPVILLVGTFEPFDESEASRVKCDGHLLKPFDTSELIQTVYSLVRDKSMSQKSEAALDPVCVPRRALGEAIKNQVHSRVRDSFLGTGRILDLFDPEILAQAEIYLKQTDTTGQKTVEASHGTDPAAMRKDHLSDDFINSVVVRVVRQMSPDVIREVAWEVVPELSEVLIRRVIEEQRKG